MDSEDSYDQRQLVEIANEFGIPHAQVPRIRRVSVQVECQPVSCLRWGDGSPRVVYLHGGSQNAHTWDLVAMRLGEPALAIDLPGHGHSGWRDDHDYSPGANAPMVAAVIDKLAPNAELVVGMSLGGLTVLSLCVLKRDLVRRAVLVDILPDLELGSSHEDRDRLVALRAASRQRYRTRDDMVEFAVSVARRRSRAALERGVVNNSVQDPDGWWRWRYDPERSAHENDASGLERLWRGVARLPQDACLVRGALSSYVGSAQLERLAQLAPWVRVQDIAEAGHSVQGDQPEALAQVIARELRR